MKKKCIIFGIILLCFLVSCAYSPSNSNDNKKRKNQTGLVRLTVETAVNNTSSRGYDVSEIHSYQVTLKGKGLTAINESIPAVDLDVTTFELQLITNLIVEVEVFDKNNQSLFSGHKMYGYGTVTAGDPITITVSWNSTPVGNVLDTLLSNDFDITTYDAALLQQAILDKKGTAGYTPLLVDTTTIAQNIIQDATYTTIDMLAGSTVTGTVTNFSDNCPVYINDPFAPPAIITGQTFTFTNIATGTWTISFPAEYQNIAPVTVTITGNNNTVNLSIAAYNKTPFIYDKYSSAFNNNGEKTAVISAYIGDENGLDDIQKVSIITADAAEYELFDDGTSTYYDTQAHDGIYETIIPDASNTGAITLRITDSGGITEYSYSGIINYLPLPECIGLANNDVTTDFSPVFSWKKTDGCSYYDLVLYKDDQVIYTKNNIPVDTTSEPYPDVLENGTYRLSITAYSKNPVSINVDNYISYPKISSTETTFTISASNTTAPFIAHEARNLYFQESYSIKSLDVKNAVATTIYEGTSTMYLMNISPRGYSLIFTEDDALYKINNDGSNKFLLFKQQNENVKYATWSPDGKTIVFRTTYGDNTDLFAINPDGSNRRLLPTWGLDKNVGIYFTKDSKHLVYVYTKNSYLNVKKISLDDHTISTIHRSSGVYEPSGIALSPDDSLFTFTDEGTKTCIVDAQWENPRTFYDRVYQKQWLSNHQIIGRYSKSLYHIDLRKPGLYAQTLCSIPYNIISLVSFPGCDKLYFSSEKGIYHVNTDGTNKELIYTVADTNLPGRLRISPYTW